VSGNEKQKRVADKKSKLYIDTSVLRGTFDDDTPDRQACTKRFWDRCRTGCFDLFVSLVVNEELESAPADHRIEIARIIKDLGIDILPKNDDAEDLARDYIGPVLKKGPRNDRRHLAYATVFECDAVVSWNMHDIVNSDTYNGMRGVNLSKGRKVVTVETPATLMGEERLEWLPPSTQ